MLGLLKNMVLCQELKKSNSQKQFVEWANVDSICVIISNESASLSAAKVFSNECGKQVDVITYVNDKTNINNEVYLSVNKKSITWLDMPGSETLKKLQSKTYDVVICGDLKNDSIIKALVLLVKAKCRVGAAELNYSKEFEISITVGSAERNIGNFLKHALKYLMMIKV